MTSSVEWHSLLNEINWCSISIGAWYPWVNNFHNWTISMTAWHPLMNDVHFGMKSMSEWYPSVNDVHGWMSSTSQWYPYVNDVYWENDIHSAVVLWPATRRLLRCHLWNPILVWLVRNSIQRSNHANAQRLMRIENDTEEQLKFSASDMHRSDAHNEDLLNLLPCQVN